MYGSSHGCDMGIGPFLGDLALFWWPLHFGDGSERRRIDGKKTHHGDWW